jgi:hypothetical protein
VYSPTASNGTSASRDASKREEVQGVLLLGTFIISKQNSDKPGTRLSVFALLNNSLPTSGIVSMSEPVFPMDRNPADV